MSNHTPGPWKIIRSSDYTGDPADTKILSIEGADETTVVPTDSGYYKLSEANARLIAAAPTMKALLLRAADQLQDYRAEIDGDYNDPVAMDIYGLLAEFRAVMGGADFL